MKLPQRFRDVFDQVECIECHRFVLSNDRTLGRWHFTVGGLIPGPLKVARGTCPTCIEQDILMIGVLKRVFY